MIATVTSRKRYGRLVTRDEYNIGEGMKYEYYHCDGCGWVGHYDDTPIVICTDDGGREYEDLETVLCPACNKPVTVWPVEDKI